EGENATCWNHHVLIETAIKTKETRSRSPARDRRTRRVWQIRAHFHDCSMESVTLAVVKGPRNLTV
ncbi:MAG: hypothetical protein ACI9N0_003193, partial [Ilumatobacter sp.]